MNGTNLTSTQKTISDQKSYERLCRENLVSFIVMSSGDAAADLAELERIAAFAQDGFAYFEILAVAARPAGNWSGELRNRALAIPNLRIITVDRSMGFEDLTDAALRIAIGDYVVCTFPGETSVDDIRQMIAVCADGQYLVVKSFFEKTRLSLFEKASASIVRRTLKLATGRTVQAFQARTFVVSRQVLSRTQAIGGVYRYFRLFDLSSLAMEGHHQIDQRPRRHLFRDLAAKIDVAFVMTSASSSRLILGLSLVCAALSGLSVLFAIGAFSAWLVLDQVAEGWTSLAIGLSVLFAANFGVMAAICLGLLHLIRQSLPDATELFASEISGGDLFQDGTRLNVERQSLPQEERK